MMNRIRTSSQRYRRHTIILRYDNIAFMTDTDQFIIHSICSITNHDYFAIIRYQISNHDWYRTTVLPEHNALLQFSQPSQFPDRHLHRPIFEFFCFSYFMITQFDFLFVPFCTNTPFCCKETNIRETVLLDTPICSA